MFEERQELFGTTKVPGVDRQPIRGRQSKAVAEKIEFYPETRAIRFGTNGPVRSCATGHGCAAPGLGSHDLEITVIGEHPVCWGRRVRSARLIEMPHHPVGQDWSARGELRPSMHKRAHRHVTNLR